MSNEATLDPAPIGAERTAPASGLFRPGPSPDERSPAPRRGPPTVTRKIGLDAVRGVAVSLVLVSHFAKSLDYTGTYGVELFFALSGFLIGGILYRTLSASACWSFADVRRFWLRRWWRTLPNYYLFLVVYTVFHACIGGLPRFTGFLPFLVFCQDLFGMKSPFFGVSWSLCIEEWFYLLFPLGVLFFTTLGCSKRRAFVCTTLFFMLFPPALREWMFAGNDPEAVRLMTVPRLDAIFYGVATAFATARFRPTALVRTMLVAVTAVGLAALAVYQHQWTGNGPAVPVYRAALVLLPLFFSLTLPFFDSVERLPSPLASLSAPITKLSLWSYSIYLSHIPILFLTYAAFGTWRDYTAVNVLSKITGLAVCIGVSRLVYERFEAPLLRLRPAEPASHA